MVRHSQIINTKHHINKVQGEGQNCINISIDAEKAFDKIQHLFITKPLKVHIKYINIVKAIYDKPTANITLDGENLKASPVRSGTRQGYGCHHWKLQSEQRREATSKTTTIYRRHDFIYI